VDGRTDGLTYRRKDIWPMLLGRPKNNHHYHNADLLRDNMNLPHELAWQLTTKTTAKNIKFWKNKCNSLMVSKKLASRTARGHLQQRCTCQKPVPWVVRADEHCRRQTESDRTTAEQRTCQRSAWIYASNPRNSQILVEISAINSRKRCILMLCTINQSR